LCLLGRQIHQEIPFHICTRGKNNTNMSETEVSTNTILSTHERDFDAHKREDQRYTNEKTSIQERQATSLQKRYSRTREKDAKNTAFTLCFTPTPFACLQNNNKRENNYQKRCFPNPNHKRTRQKRNTIPYGSLFFPTTLSSSLNTVDPRSFLNS
jgi:hypothetical protein